MKIRLAHLALLVALPSAVYAGSYSSFAKEVHFVKASATERLATQKANAYDLVWNHTAGKFAAKRVIIGEPLMMDQPRQQTNQAPAVDQRALAI